MFSCLTVSLFYTIWNNSLLQFAESIYLSLLKLHILTQNGLIAVGASAYC